MKKLTFTFLAIAMSIAVFAADQVVTDNGDAGAGTLRQAILDVGDGETITFSLGIGPGDELITISSQFNTITKSITIDGANTATNGHNVTVEVTEPGISLYRIFYFDGANKTFTLNNIELEGGVAESGGAISMQHGDLSMDNVIVRLSKSTIGAGGGGGVYILHATSTSISNSQFYDNEATGTSGSSGDAGNGGAIAIHSGTASISNCTFIGNKGVVHGGAIYTKVNLDISGSTFKANTCDGYGGAINFHDGESTVTNCTFSENNATGANGWGGAMMIGDDVNPPNSLKVTLRFATVAGNTSGASDGNGGGIYLWKGEADIQNCFLGDNTNNDFYGFGTTLTDGGYNIVEVQGGTMQLGPTNNILGQQANLFGTGISSQTLAHNGGPTQTLKIEHGSVASGAGVADAGVANDQRGETRADPPTIGAFEFLNTPFAWTGTTDTDWATATNWDSGSVPTEHDAVVIPAAPTSQPVVATGTTDAVCHNLKIDASASLTVEGKLTFHHNVDNYGELIVNGEMEYATAPLPPALAVGDLHEGGIVIHLDGNGGGLVCAMHYVKQNGQEWGNTWGHMNSEVTGTGTAIGTGQANTTAIVAHYGNGSAYSARTCADFSESGFTDWFLPSKEELHEMHVNFSAINTGLSANGGDELRAGGTHWSSSEISDNKAWFETVSDGSQTDSDKSGTAYCRPVRAF